MLKLGTSVKDKATGISGSLVHLIQFENGTRFYNFQPRGLQKKSGDPAKKFYVVPDRIIGGVEVPDVDLHLEVLGTEVEDSSSGFKGVATSVTLHLNGCLHFEVQPAGLTEEGNKYATHDFDMRSLVGVAIKPCTEEQHDKSLKEKPSPCLVGEPLFKTED